MKQVVMVGPRKSEVIDVPIPEITDDQLLVKVTYTGMCHSEWYPWTVAQPGELFGHESVGVVARCGRNVTGFKEGDRVTGLGGGGLREFIVMEPEKVVHVPDNLKDEDAIVEPLACLLSAAVKMPLTTLGDSVAVVGCGYMGLGMISLFKAMGYGDIVAVDIRKGSPTFGKHVAVELSGENKRQLFIPRGFAHGFAVLSDEAVFAYKCDNIYMPSHERGIAFDDPALGIDWRIRPEKWLLSPKDETHPPLAETPPWEEL